MRFFFLLYLFFLYACGPPLQHHYICVDDYKNQRVCTKEEIRMIDGLRAIISQVRNFNEKNIDDSFKQTGNELKDSRVIFFGEEHTDIVSQIETLGAINYLAKPHDTVLVEGGDKNTPIELNCGYYLLLSLFLNWQWEKLGRPYNVANVKEKNIWQKKIGLGQIFFNTRYSYDISDLTLAKLYCSYWDDEQSIKETIKHNNVTTQTLEKRNESMVSAMKSAFTRGSKRVFISAGFRHMPFADIWITQRINKDQGKIVPSVPEDYYAFVRSKRASKNHFRLDSGSGTTEIIFNYLKNHHIPFREYIHQRLAQ